MKNTTSYASIRMNMHASKREQRLSNRQTITTKRLKASAQNTVMLASMRAKKARAKAIAERTRASKKNTVRKPSVYPYIMTFSAVKMSAEHVFNYYVDNPSASTNEPLFVETLERLAMAVTRSVFRHVDKASADEVTHQIYIDCLHQLDIEEDRRTANKKARTSKPNRNGRMISEVLDDEAERVRKESAMSPLSALDVYHAVVLELMESIRDAINQRQVILLEQSFEDVKKNGAQTIIGFDEIAPKEYTFSTTIIRNAFVAGRREIENQKNMRASNPKYVYIECGRIEETDTMLYRRFNASALIGGYANVGATMPSNYETLKNEWIAERLLAKLELTDVQKRRLTLKIQGLSIDQIARVENKKSKNAVQKSIDQIRAKAERLLTGNGVKCVDEYLDKEYFERGKYARREQRENALENVLLDYARKHHEKKNGSLDVQMVAPYDCGYENTWKACKHENVRLDERNEDMQAWTKEWKPWNNNRPYERKHETKKSCKHEKRMHAVQRAHAQRAH